MKLTLFFAILISGFLSGCTRDPRTELVIQRFFGACEAQYGDIVEVANAEGECGIMTAIINKFEAENPDIKVVENVVFWPGYDQLTAQLAANDVPDLVTMHGSVLSDYQSRGLLTELDEHLATANIDITDLTDAARRAVTIESTLWGLPIDTWAPLWHINVNLFEQAGLVEDGKPILPRTSEELFAHARQFRKRTGLPYFVQGAANEYAGFTRNFYTYVMQQGGALFDENGMAKFNTPEGAEAIQLFKTIFDEDFTTKNQDYSAAVSGFIRGDGGVFLVGTWMVGSFDQASRDASSALSDGYAVVPYPNLFSSATTYADGHNWVMPFNPKRTTEETAAAQKFLSYFAGQNFHWSRTGHLPVFTSVIGSEAWRDLPHRDGLAELANTATPLPKNVRRQFPLETIVGQESSAAISGSKTIDQALSDMERRVNEILSHL